MASTQLSTMNKLLFFQVFIPTSDRTADSVSVTSRHLFTDVRHLCALFVTLGSSAKARPTLVSVKRDANDSTNTFR